jgi:hypothetical protein
MTRTYAPEPSRLSERLVDVLFATVLALSFGFGQKALAQAVPHDLLPTTLHSYQLRKTTDFERHYKGLGRSFSFFPIGGEHAVITVYVYDHNRDHIPDGVTSDLLNQELQKAKRDIFLSKPDAIQIGDDEEILREAISYKFAAFDLPDKWEPDFSLLHMTARGNFFVKVRSTMASNRHLNRSLHDQDLFLRELSKELYNRLPLKSRN